MCVCFVGFRYDRYAKPARRLFQVNAEQTCIGWSKDEKKTSINFTTDSSIDFKDVTAVVTGKQTSTLKKHKKAIDAMCFSIISPKKSLNLEASSEQEVKLWLDLFKIIAKEKGLNALVPKTSL